MTGDEAISGLLDREAVVDVCVRYATALDRRDWTLLRACFVPDVVGEYAPFGTLRGYEEIERVCRGALEPLDASQHLLGNFVVVVHDDGAESTCYLQAQHVRRGTPGGDNYLVGGRYTDRHVRGADGWRITNRRLDVTWTDGNPAVVGPSVKKANDRKEFG